MSYARVPRLPRPIVRSLLLAAALGSVNCAGSRRAPEPAAPWTLSMLGGECTLSGRGSQATTGACALLGSIDLRDHPAAGALGGRVAALTSTTAAIADGRSAAELTHAGARATMIHDGWEPIARELKAILRAQPSTTALAERRSLYRWHVATEGGRCNLAGEGAVVLTVDCPGLHPMASLELAPLTTWLQTAIVAGGGREPAGCSVATELAEPYAIAAESCGALRGILDGLVAASALPRDPRNKLDAAASLALAQLADGDDPVVNVALEWTVDPADRARIVALGGVFSSTKLHTIQGLQIKLRALPAVAQLDGIARIELASALGADAAPSPRVLGDDAAGPRG